MKFDEMTTDDLANELPESENQHWEFKDAILLTKEKRKQELPAELGKQVSGFANSGGGYILFGFDDKTHAFQSCEQAVGRQRMKEFIVTMVQQSVEPLMHGVQVHRIPFTNDPEQSVFVVVIPDSPSAPHQCSEKGDRRYYRRTDFNTEAAPHFYLDLLRNRFTKTILKIEGIIPHLQNVMNRNLGNRGVVGSMISLTLNISIRNTSSQIATSWGVEVKSSECTKWFATENTLPLHEGACISGQQDLLPGQRAVLSANFRATVETKAISRIIGSRTNLVPHLADIRNVVKAFVFSFRPISQNHVGDAYLYGSGTPNRGEDGFLTWFVDEGRKLGIDWE